MRRWGSPGCSANRRVRLRLDIHSINSLCVISFAKWWLPRKKEISLLIYIFSTSWAVLSGWENLKDISVWLSTTFSMQAAGMTFGQVPPMASARVRGTGYRYLHSVSLQGASGTGRMIWSLSGIPHFFTWSENGGWRGQPTLRREHQLINSTASLLWFLSTGPANLRWEYLFVGF